MKRFTLHLACAFGGAACGILIGRLVALDPGQPVSSSDGSTARGRPDRRGHGVTTGSQGKHDLAALLKMRQQGRLHDSPLSRDLERLSAGKLRELLLELKDQTKGDEGAASEEGSTLLQTVAVELYRREGMDSLPWADGMEKGAFRSALMRHLIAEAAFDSPVLSKPWIDRFMSEDDPDSINEFRWKLMSGAQARGAADVVQVEELFGERFSTILKPAIPYPEGFDYHTLFTGIRPDHDLRHNTSMEYWAGADKEAAWKGILDVVQLHGRNGAFYFGALFSGAGGFEEDPAARRWALGKLDEMPDTFRADAVKSIADLGRLEPATAVTFLKDLPRESDRITLVSAIITPSGNEEKLLPAIRALGSGSAIQEALLTAAHDNRYGGETQTTHAKRTLEKFTQLMDGLDLSPEAREGVVAALGRKR